MRIKRWVCALLCLALLLGVLPEVRAAEVSGNFEYKRNANGSVTITGCRDLSLTELVIPAEIEGRPVHAIADTAFEKCTKLRRLVVSEGVEEIGMMAFSTPELRELVLPASLRRIGSSNYFGDGLEKAYIYTAAFEFDLFQAKRIYLPYALIPILSVRKNQYCPVEEFGFDPLRQELFTRDGLTYAVVDGEACLVEAQPEGDFTVPDRLGGCPVTRIAPCCFLGAKNLRDLTLPDSVRVIGRGAMFLDDEIHVASDSHIRMTALPASLESVGDLAFAHVDLSKLPGLPDALKTVGRLSFFGCGMTSLEVPGSVRIVSLTAFGGNPFTRVVFCDGVEALESNAINMRAGTVTVPASVTSIDDNMIYFTGDKADVTVIGTSGSEAERYCRKNGVNFRDVESGELVRAPYETVQGGVRYAVYPRSHADVLELKEGHPADLVIPATVDGEPVETVRDWGLCSETVRSIVLPDTVKHICDMAFIDCSSLEKLTLGEGLERIDSQCFPGQLRILQIPASVQQIGADSINPDMLITGAAGSYAERFARSQGVSFLALEEGVTYVSDMGALCRVEDGAAVVVALAVVAGDRNQPYYSFGRYYEVPDTVDGYAVVGIDSDVLLCARWQPDTIFLGRNLQYIGEGALLHSQIKQVHTFPALTQIPERLLNYPDPNDDRVPQFWGFAGSEAERYALAHGFRFTAIDDTPFIDVSRESWFFPAVFTCYWSGLMVGTSQTTFSPNATASRAMLVTVLKRQFDPWSSAGETHFTDVPMGAWYYDPVNWAAENGVVYGTGPGTFSPNAPVTREQMVTILFRLSAAMDLDVERFAPLNRFHDADQVSDYARSALMWAVDTGLIQGNDRGMLNPRGRATRAEMATLLVRFFLWIEEEVTE